MELRHGPNSYGRQQWGILHNGRKPDAATPREGRRSSDRKLLSLGKIMTVPLEEAPANYVPAAAVIRRGQALSGIIGRKGCVGGLSSLWLKCGAQRRSAKETDSLEYGRSEWNSMCSGKMRKYMEEHQWRRRLTRPILTLRHESVGSKQD